MCTSQVCRCDAGYHAGHQSCALVGGAQRCQTREVPNNKKYQPIRSTKQEQYQPHVSLVGDFVAFKLDIDNVELEDWMMSAIQEPNLRHMIGEMYVFMCLCVCQCQVGCGDAAILTVYHTTGFMSIITTLWTWLGWVAYGRNLPPCGRMLYPACRNCALLACTFTTGHDEHVHDVVIRCNLCIAPVGGN